MNRTRLPTTRDSTTHKFTIGQWKIYFTVGLYPDGRPGELFINAIEGPEVGVGLKGALNQWAIAVSMLLQAGATVEDLEKKFAHARYEPSGFTGHPTLRHADSISDYAIRFLKEVETTAQKGTSA
jgi:ribonucleoside-diphosphate reductase alpha chain